MNKTLKKVIVVFTLLCVLLLLVFAVELFRANRGRDRDENGQQEPPEIAETDPNGYPSDVNDQPPPVEETEPGDPREPTGVRFELEMLGDAALVLYVDDALFEHEAHEMSHVFRYADTALEISIIPMPDGPESMYRGFLDNYFDYTGGEIDFFGRVEIGASPLSGYFVSASRDGETYQAWLMEFEDFQGFGLAFVINFHNESQRDALYDILDTMRWSD